MNKLRTLASVIFAAVMLACLAGVGAAQTAGDGSIATVTGGGSSVRWEVTAAHGGGTLTVTFPDGRVIRRNVRPGASMQLTVGEKYFDSLPDGAYTYDLRLAPVLSAGMKETLAKARGNDDDPEAERTGRKRASVPALAQSGSFAMVNGSIVVAGGVESTQDTKAVAAPARTALSTNVARRIRNNHRAFFVPDQVIPDDLIVQGSACVGLDCVNGEVFGFDTIRMKENNTRLQFDDTSTSQGFPTNNWQVRANGSASGSASFLGFVDQGATGNSETGTIVAQFTAGAPANSINVASTGKVGFRTATPVLDLHMNTSDTPAVRFEQNNSGGFAAQTWDIGANEANFFVRDVTSGSRLPFRIRPGAPTSSIDIAADGDVGIGTASPSFKMSVATDATGSDPGMLELRGATNGNRHLLLGYETTANYGYIAAGEAGVSFRPLALNPNGGNVGIGTNAPTDALSVSGNASKSAGGTSWAVFSDERLKNIKGRFSLGLNALMQLQPIRFEYKQDNALGLKAQGEQVGFGAQSLEKVIPEAVTRNSNGYLMVNSDPILWTMLNAIQEQQKQIEDLKAEVEKLRAASRTPKN